MKDYLVKGRQRVDLDRLIEGGKIAVVSFPACVDGFSAAVVAKLLKGGFYTELQKRQNSKKLAGIIMDEYPLVASCGRFGDGVNLQTIRSKCGFMVAAPRGRSRLIWQLAEQTANSLC